jgi:hypothetical protein
MDVDIRDFLARLLSYFLSLYRYHRPARYTGTENTVSSLHIGHSTLAFYSDERVLFVFGICFLHLELEGSMRDSSLLLLCVYSKSSFSSSLFCVFASLGQLLYIPDLI